MTVWRYGDDVNTDQLFPGKYTYTCRTIEEILPHLLEDLDPGFSTRAKEGDIIVAGKNFGCGSSREQPVLGLKALGIRAVIAKSFARIFYRAAINQGLVLIECPEAVEKYSREEEIEIDTEEGKILVAGRRYEIPSPPDRIRNIWKAGGLLPFVRERLREERKKSRR